MLHCHQINGYYVLMLCHAIVQTFERHVMRICIWMYFVLSYPGRCRQRNIFNVIIRCKCPFHHSLSKERWIVFIIDCVLSTLLNSSREVPSMEPSRFVSQVSDGWRSPSYQSCVGSWNEAKSKIARTHRRFYPDFKQIDYWDEPCTKPIVFVWQK